MSRLGAAGWTAIGRRWSLCWFWAILFCIIGLLLMQTVGPEV